MKTMYSEKQNLESALTILRIKYNKSDSEDKLKELLNNAMKHPLSESEWEIRQNIEILVNEANNPSKSKKALSKLKELVSYSSNWD